MVGGGFPGLRSPRRTSSGAIIDASLRDEVPGAIFEPSLQDEVLTATSCGDRVAGWNRAGGLGHASGRIFKGRPGERMVVRRRADAELAFMELKA